MKLGILLTRNRNRNATSQTAARYVTSNCRFSYV